MDEVYDFEAILQENKEFEAKAKMERSRRKKTEKDCKALADEKAQLQSDLKAEKEISKTKSWARILQLETELKTEEERNKKLQSDYKVLAEEKLTLENQLLAHNQGNLKAEVAAAQTIEDMARHITAAMGNLTIF